MKSYDKAKSYLENVFAPEREKVIRDLTSIRKSVQEAVEIHRLANVGYSYFGILGGLAMLGGMVVTGGMSLFAPGALIGAYSGYAEIAHEVVQKSILIKRFSDAEKSLRNHELTLSEMNKLLLSLKEDIDKIDSLQSRIELLEKTKSNEKTQAAEILFLIGQIILIMGTNTDPKELANNRSKVYRLIKLSKLVEIVLPTGGKVITMAAENGYKHLDATSITKKFGKKSVKVITTAFAVIADLNSLINNTIDVVNFEKGHLCTEAEKLNQIIIKLQWDLDSIRECFRNT